MRRDVDLSEISDGRFYSGNHMVRADCGDCKGCSYCCHAMADTIILDPYDCYELCKGLGVTPDRIIEKVAPLRMVDSMALPALALEEENGCPYLTQEGRCGVHSFRPGFCRLFPLGRYYREETRDFVYFLQTHECQKEDRTKVKVKDWIGVPQYEKYERFVADWHFFLKDLESVVSADPSKQKGVLMLVLRNFYLTPFDATRDFYEQFYERLGAFT